MTTPIPEIDILVAREPSADDNTDEWPEFTLTHVNVYLPHDRNATTSLLEASVGYPLTVEGKLEPLDEEDAHLYQQAARKKHMRIMLEDVKTFSYGQYGDGSTAIWAAGRAGWFTIKPSKAYKGTYQAMVDAANLLYFVADNYREPRKKGKGKNATVLPDYTAQELFEKYAAEELGSSDASEGADKFHEHKEFLVSSMLGGKEGLAWSKLPIYRHFYNKFPDLFTTLRKRLEAPPAKKAQEEEKTSLRAKAKHSRQGSVDSMSTTGTTRRRGRPPRKISDVTSGDVHSDVSAAVRDSLVQAVREDSEISSSRRTARKPVSRRTRHHSSTEPTPEVEDRIATPARDDDTDEETKLRARKNKSSLRPRASKGTKSAARKGGKRPLVDDEDDDNELGTLSSPMAAKRKYADDVDTRPASKRRNSRPHDDEGIDIPTSPSESGDANGTESPALPGAFGETSELALRSLNHVPDPVHEDTWVCALDGCNHKVYAASNLDSQRLIKEHYALHAYDDDERVQMVKKLQAPSLPASHLMEKVKMQAKLEGFPGSVSRQMASRYPMTLPPLNLGVAQRY